VGCSGKLSGTSSGWPHPVMYSATNTKLGSMLLEIEGNRLTAKFVTSDSTVYDQFTMLKNSGKKQTISACSGDVIHLHPSWPGEAEWFPSNQVSDSLPLTVTLNTTVFAYDPSGCITDTFNIQVLPSPPCAVQPTSVIENLNPIKFSIRPSLSDGVLPVWVITEATEVSNARVQVSDMHGRMVMDSEWRIQSGPNAFQINTQSLESGNYVVSVFSSGTVRRIRFTVVR
ncbi:MAG: T9SS type A sorting domain-containing protein, partial [Flavobacteriales bacterium]